jgi:hypothetical protein
MLTIRILEIRFITILICLMIFSFSLVTGNLNNARNIIYTEAFGTAGYGSVNFERLIGTKGNMRIGFRGGLGTYNIYDFTGKFNPDLIFPLSLNMYLFEPHCVELGVGNTLSSIVQLRDAGWQPERQKRLSANFILGYRYYRNEGGLIIRIGYTPIIEFYRRLVHWGGISVGYAF